MSKIVIVADDLTGANANGSLLVRKGFTAATCLSTESWNPALFSDIDAVSFNSDSRLLTPEKAYEVVYKAMTTLIKEATPAIISKRIDSTLRGNMGQEIEAALKAIEDSSSAESPAPIAIVVPAFPSSSRLAVGGYLIVNGVPLESTSIAKDPTSPIETSKFTELLNKQTSLSVGYIDLSTILSGTDAIKEAISSLHKNGTRIICCDAVTDENISSIAEAVKDAAYPILAVDPGPFTATLADLRLTRNTRHELDNKVLVIVGSTTPLVQRQMDELRLKRRCSIERVDCQKLVDPKQSAKAIDEVVNKLLNAGDQSKVYGVCTVEKADDVLPLEKIAAACGVSLHAASNRINNALAEIASRLLHHKHMHFGGLYTSGGEVTVAVTKQLKATGFSVRDEIIPLAVYGRLIGGEYPDMAMVTKGGFVGNADTVVECIDYLFTKISTQPHQTLKNGE